MLRRDPIGSTTINSVAIIGIGCLFPRADNLESYWSNICNRVDAITEVPPTHWRPADYLDQDPKAPDRVYAARGGFLSPVDFPPLEFGITPNALEATDTTQLLGLMVARQALEDAGYGAGRTFDRNRVSVILGVTGTLELVIPLGARLGHPLWRKALKEAGVADAVADDVVQRIADSYVGWQEDSFPGLLGNVAAGRIANRLDLGGTNCVVDAACASSLGAVHLALLELASGRADMVLSGGLDTFNDIFMYMCFSKTPALSPTGHARPFDAKGDGTILGEGLGIVVLKRLADAVRDHDKVYAVIRGIGSSSDGKGNAIYAPSPAGQAKALRQAYRVAGVTPDTIELVEAHGTGTRAGDAAEVTALTEVYGGSDQPGAVQSSRHTPCALADGTRSVPATLPTPDAPRSPSWCALGSVKSQIGHTKAAAGAAGLIKAALALHHKVLPPTIKVEQPIELAAPGRSPFYVNTEKRPWLPSPVHPRRAAVSSFGFGGSNFHCVLEEYQPAKPAIAWDGDVQLVAFSADTRADLSAQLERWPAPPKWDEVRLEAARTREAFQGTHACRLLLVLNRESHTDAVSRARALLDKFRERSYWSTPERVYFGSGAPAGKLGLLFPGQGSQYVGMLRDLACQFPHMLEALVELEALGEDRAGASRDSAPATLKRLSEFIYPQPVFSPEQLKSNEEALRATAVAQPAIGAVSLGALRVLEHFGVRADAVAGHSYGELVALCAAGCFGSATLHQLSRQRGQLMAGTATSGRDPGAMLAVRAPLATVEGVLREEGLELIVANRNAPSQFVLSGATAEIDRARAVFQRRQLECRPLPVAAAFHSPFVAAVREPFLQALAAVDFQPGTLPVFSNTTARHYPPDPAEARNLLADQLVRPVAFLEEIDNMYQSGVRTFLEVGPSNKLTGLVGAILEGREHVALALDASSGKRPGTLDLACALAQLAARGHSVDLHSWDEGRRAPKPGDKKPTMTVPLCGANYVKPRTPKAVAPASNGAPPPKIERQSEVARVPQSVGQRETETKRSSDRATEQTAREPGPMTDPLRKTGPDPATTQALRITQDNLAALQKLGEQTAQLHRQFLEGQDKVLQAFQTLLEQQRTLLPLTETRRDDVPARQVREIESQNRRTERPKDRESDRQRDGEKERKPERVTEQSVPAIAPALPPAIAPPLAASASAAEKILLDVVAEKTGYPAEMLALDMELDADLGIDSIKRVEIFSSLQERLPEAPAVKPEHLGTLRTLRHVVEFLGNSPPERRAEPETARPVDGRTEPRPEPRDGNNHGVEQLLLGVVAEKTGYPADMLALDMELDADLGIDSIKRVEIFSTLQERLPDAPVVKPEHLGTLRTLRHVVEFLGSSAPSVSPYVAPSGHPVTLSPCHPVTLSPSPLQRLVLECVTLDEAVARTSISLAEGGEIWITEEASGLSARLASRLSILGQRPRLIALADWRALARPTTLAGLVIVAPVHDVDDAFVKDAFALLQLAGPGLRQAGKNGGAVLLSVSRLDGSFGLERLEGAPTSGGLAGLVKTAGHEWPEVHCKALDLAPTMDSDEAALALAEELLLVGPVEVGVAPQGRCTLRLTERSLPAVAGPTPIATGEVVVLTGGARGVTAEVALALARFGPTLVLLGRSPPPGPEPDWLSPLSDESAIKRALVTHANGVTPAPKEIAEQYQRIAAQREIRRNLERITAAGARVLYRCVDVRQAEEVHAVLSEVRATVGPVRGLMHGAGVLADRLIADKTAEQFARVYDTKVAGLQHILQSLNEDALRFLVLFSSSTGRWGRSGQVDYAAANEVLNKRAQQEARRRPGCRVVSVNWGPWDGGMVTPALKDLFAREGVGVIPLREGAEYLVRELCAQETFVEVVVLGNPPSGSEAATGYLESSPLPRTRGRGAGGEGVEPEEILPPRPLTPTPLPRSTGGEGLSGQPLTCCFERMLTLDDYPVLRSHVLDGRAVLPMALTVEWLAHGALHALPGLSFHGFDGLRILKGVRLEEGETRTMRVHAGKAVKDGTLYRVPVEMRGSGEHGRDMLHARAEIVLTERLPAPELRAADVPLRPYPRGKAEIYESLLFHGPDLHGIEEVEGCSAEGITASVATAPAPAAWIRQPLRPGWLAEPLVLDAAFQLMILWSFENHQAGSLPCFAGSYRQYRRSFPREGVRALAVLTRNTGPRALADIDFVDADGVLIARLKDYECVIDAALSQAFRRNRLAAVPSS